MGTRLLEIVKQVGVFIICAQMILHFKPAESYGKYLRLLMSTMVLVQLVVPVFGLLKGNMQETFVDRVSFYREELEDNMEKISLTGVLAEDILERMTLEEVKKRLEAVTGESPQWNGTQTEKPITDGLQVEEPQAQHPAIQIDRIEVKEDE